MARARVKGIGLEYGLRGSIRAPSLVVASGKDIPRHRDFARIMAEGIPGSAS
jgi:hypothetical protein